jgi:hypothetical protein
MGVADISLASACDVAGTTSRALDSCVTGANATGAAGETVVPLRNNSPATVIISKSMANAVATLNTGASHGLV